jgi:hypothetical protein
MVFIFQNHATGQFNRPFRRQSAVTIRPYRLYHRRDKNKSQEHSQTEEIEGHCMGFEDIK